MQKGRVSFIKVKLNPTAANGRYFSYTIVSSRHHDVGFFLLMIIINFYEFLPAIQSFQKILIGNFL
jgi:hypothetical protein